MKLLKYAPLFLWLFIIGNCKAQKLFVDDFSGDLSGWQINSSSDVILKDSKDILHGKVMELIPNGKVLAIIKKSNKWGAIRMEGELLFPEKVQNYLGFIYNYQKRGKREDFGVLYVKGNGSYIRANPWRDGNVSRLLYEEYKTKLEVDQAIKIGQWHSFAVEVIKEKCHLYINDMMIPKVTFDLFEFNTGKIGFQPRVVGGSVWIDNIEVSSIDRFTYQGNNIPDLDYQPHKLVTTWEVLGPFKKPNPKIEQSVASDQLAWEVFEVDRRGAVITGKVTEFEGSKTVAYFRTFIEAKEDKVIKLHFTTTDELTIFLNGKGYKRVYRDGYISKTNDWNAWYDFWENPQHAGYQLKIPLKKGQNQIIIKVRNGQFASGGFFVYQER